MTSPTRDPLRPLAFIVDLLLSLLLTWLIAAPLLALIPGLYIGFGAFGFEPACVEIPQSGLWLGDVERASVLHLRAGVSEAIPHEIRLCQAGMDAATRALFTAPVALDWLWMLGFLALAKLLIMRARRFGLFTQDVARGVSRLGWFVLGGHVVVNLVSGLCRALGTTHLVDDFAVGFGTINDMDLSWAVIVGGFGILTVGRIMRESVGMHDDLEGTV